MPTDLLLEIEGANFTDSEI